MIGRNMQQFIVNIILILIYLNEFAGNISLFIQKNTRKVDRIRRVNLDLPLNKLQHQIKCCTKTPNDGGKSNFMVTNYLIKFHLLQLNKKLFCISQIAVAAIYIHLSVVCKKCRIFNNWLNYLSTSKFAFVFRCRAN